MKAVVKTILDLENLVRKIDQDQLLNGKAMTVTLTPFRRPRSIDQNSKMHVLFRELADHCGYSEAEIKEYFKSEFGPAKILEIAGNMKVIPKGTSEYSIDECNRMIDRIYQVAAEAGCQLPEER